MDLDEIIPNLFLGDIMQARNVQHLKENKITHIISVGETLEEDKYKDFTLFPKIITALDREDENLLQHFDEATEFINEARKQGRVFVHCAAGVSRSASIVIAYVMKTNNLDFEAALALVKSKRSIVYPNTGFREQLNLYNRLKFTVNKESDDYKQFCAKLEIKREEIRNQWRELYKQFAGDDTAVTEMFGTGNS
jgi:dual specificity phosphatase 12